MAILPPCACTALVTLRWKFTSARRFSVPPNGKSHPWRFGEIPPVMMSPTPPRARSSK